jgi:hypothetical protein
MGIFFLLLLYINLYRDLVAHSFEFRSVIDTVPGTIILVNCMALFRGFYENNP